MNTVKYDLKSCPFCSSSDVDLINIYDVHGQAIGGRIVCYSCDVVMLLDPCASENDLVNSWNNRPESEVYHD